MTTARDRPSIEDFNPLSMTDLTRLPTLDELRARRKEAMRRAGRRLLPWIAIAVALDVPAVAGFWMVQTGRVPFARALPFIIGSTVASFIWLTALIVTYVKRTVPEELRRASLVCHVCGEPLVVRPNAAGTRTIPSDPAMRALMEGRCASCQAVVVSDLPALVGAGAGQPTLNSSRARA